MHESKYIYIYMSKYISKYIYILAYICIKWLEKLRVNINFSKTFGSKIFGSKLLIELYKMLLKIHKAITNDWKSHGYSLSKSCGNPAHY